MNLAVINCFSSNQFKINEFMHSTKKCFFHRKSVFFFLQLCAFLILFYAKGQFDPSGSNRIRCKLDSLYNRYEQLFIKSHVTPYGINL